MLGFNCSIVQSEMLHLHQCSWNTSLNALHTHPHTLIFYFIFFCSEFVKTAFLNQVYWLDDTWLRFPFNFNNLTIIWPLFWCFYYVPIVFTKAFCWLDQVEDSWSSDIFFISLKGKVVSKTSQEFIGRTMLGRVCFWTVVKVIRIPRSLSLYACLKDLQFASGNHLYIFSLVGWIIVDANNNIARIYFSSYCNALYSLANSLGYLSRRKSFNKQCKSTIIVPQGTTQPHLLNIILPQGSCLPSRNIRTCCNIQEANNL